MRHWFPSSVLCLASLTVGCGASSSVAGDDGVSDARRSPPSADAGRSADAVSAADAAAPPVDAGRLRPVWAAPQGAPNADEHTALLLDWLDTTSDTECSFARGPDGTLRCAPVESAGLHVFSTRSCEPGSDAVAELVSLGAPRPDCRPRLVTYGYIDSVADGPNALHVFRLTGPAQATDASHPYIQSVFGACNARPAPPPPPDPGPEWVYCALEEVPLTDLAAATTDVSPMGGARLEVLQGEGASAPRRLMHAAHDVTLVPDWHADAQLIPNAPEGIIGCTQGDPCGACDAPVGCLRADAVATGVVRVGTDNNCDEPVYVLGRAEPGAVACGAQGDAQGATCYALGEAVAPLPYQPLHLGEGRLRPEWIGLDGTPAVPTGYFWDEDLGTTCFADLWSAERVTCLPASWRSGAGPPRGWRSVFAAEQRGHCEQPLGYVYLPGCGETGARYRRDPDWVEMVESSAPVPETLYAGIGPWGDQTHNCQPLDAEGSSLYDAVAVDEARFAVVERRVAR